MILGSGSYIYHEASNCNRGDQAVLRSPTIRAGSPATSMKFAYHMRGSTMGELKLEKVAAGGTRTTIFSNSKSEYRWKTYEFSLPTENYDYEV